jgi:hypothetical protein
MLTLPACSFRSTVSHIHDRLSKRAEFLFYAALGSCGFIRREDFWILGKSARERQDFPEGRQNRKVYLSSDVLQPALQHSVAHKVYAVFHPQLLHPVSLMRIYGLDADL